MQYELTKKFAIITGFDFGRDKYNSTNYGFWYSPIVIVRQLINKKTQIALRAEYYGDPKQIIVATNTNNGFKIFGVSSNFDCSINSMLKFRIEGKMYRSKGKIFNGSNYNYSVTSNVSIKL
jgi:hypothetical protein